MKLVLSIVPVLLLCATSVYCQTDSITYLEEVEVVSIDYSAYAAGTTIDRVSLSSDLSIGGLQRQSSIYFREYGNGQLSSISLRGTSAAQTQVLWNDIPVNSPTLGQTDFSIWPSFLVDDIAVVRGSASALFGSGSIGGSVVMDTKKIKRDSALAIRVGVGSFGYMDIGAKAQYSFSRKLKAETRLFRSTLENDFPYRFGSEERIQDHAAVERMGFSQKVTLEGPNARWFSEVGYASNEREIQPPLGSASRDQIVSEQLRAVIVRESKKTSISTSSSLGYNFDQTIFNDSLVTNSHLLVLNLKREQWLKNNIKMFYGANLQHAIATSENYQELGRQANFDAFTSLHLSPLYGLMITGTIRGSVNNVGFQYLPALGFSYAPLENKTISISGQYNKGFRIPTLNDHFWTPGGNQNLLPEESHNLEIGLETTFKMISFKMNRYSSHVQNRIIWTSEGSFFSPDNLDGVIISGSEFFMESEVELGAVNLFLDASFEIVDSSRKNNRATQLPYIPRNAGFGQFGINSTNSSGSISVNYTGQRFSTLSNSEAGKIDGFLLTDVNLGRSILLPSFSLDVGITIRNVFNTEFQNILNTSMPGRNFLISITTKI